MSILKHKISFITCSLISFAIGAACTIVTMLALGYQQVPDPEITAVVVQKEKDRKAEARRKRFQRAFALLRLSALVSRLDVLTADTPALKLKAQEQAKLTEQLRNLAQIDELTTDDAKDRYETITEILRDHETILKAVGVRMSRGRFKLPPDTPNPFAKGDSRIHLESLLKRFPSKS